MATPIDLNPFMPNKVWVAVQGLPQGANPYFPESAGGLMSRMKGMTAKYEIPAGMAARVLVPSPGNSAEMLKLRTQQLIKAYSGSLSAEQINGILAESVASVGSAGGGVAAAVAAPLTAVAQAAAAAVGAPVAAAAAAVKAVAKAFTPEDSPAYFNEEKGIFEPLNKVAQAAAAAVGAAARGPKRVASPVRAQPQRIRNPCQRFIDANLTKEEKKTMKISQKRKLELQRLSNDESLGISYAQITQCLSKYETV